ncbi:uncharacterized protein F4807DRAFT_207625 [Annulohypoxylon truncatum]|uniref:uncharacterized protein n=1 Tax=Annulohypoxylon truncatum TaxID=327061 RepID=UPI002007B874|nr:uncharacterized protein F4807DRAFT_207625 [Annulohypoxylon truncatum]KAI1213977.1 hypothetical protein F4807DRAFT_207625 [Annulohypoxylon truncatum]
MEKVVCSCASCNEYLAEFFNRWIKIGKSYISPVIDTDEIFPGAPTGAVRLGEKETLVENCHLQDIACSCDAIVGLRCLDTPVNHVLHDGQLFLRLSSIKTRAVNDHKLVDIKIQRTLKLREASHSGSTTANTPPASEDSANMPMDHDGPSEIHGHLLDHIQDQLDAQREETQRLNRAGFQMASSFDNAVLRIEGEIKKLKDGMGDLRDERETNCNKIDAIDDNVAQLRIIVDDVKNASQNKSAYTRLDEELASAKQAIADVRLSLNNELDKSTKRHQRKHETLTSDLNAVRLNLGAMRDELDGTKKTINKRISAENIHGTEIASLRAELKELREELAKERSQKTFPRGSMFPSREIDILTTNITKIGQRANQIETLQMAFELLKERVQRMEKGSTSNDQDASETGNQNRHSIDLLPEVSRRKRKHSPRPEETTDLPTPQTTSSSKKPTRQLRSNSPLSNHGSLWSSPRAKAQTSDAQTADSPRLTKSGAVDKRSMRRLTRLAASQNTGSND